VGERAVASSVDYTKIPAEMEKKFEELDEDSALHATIINPGNTWTKKFNKSLLSAQETTTVSTDVQERERNQAFDLLDALTKSGALSIDQASLHVVIAATHCFEKSLMQTVVQDNVNPIEKVEQSSLIVASTIHQMAPLLLVGSDHAQRIGTNAPRLASASAGVHALTDG
jgi:ribosome maturation protein Sdo1